MAFTPGSLFDSDARGATETIDLKPVPPATSTNAIIASAFYGTPPQPVPIASNRKSLTISVLPGLNQLVVTLVSPSPNDESVILVGGTTILANPTVRQHSAVSVIFIKGT